VSPQDSFTPKEVAIIRVRAEDRPRTNQNATRGKFHDATTSKTYYKDWGVNIRMRHGDFHEAYKKLTFPEKVGSLFSYFMLILCNIMRDNVMYS